MSSFFDNIYNAALNSPLQKLRFNNEKDTLVQIDAVEFSQSDESKRRGVAITIFTYRDPYENDEQELTRDNVYIATIMLNDKLEGTIENEAEVEAYKFKLGSNLDSDFEDLSNPEFPMETKCQHSMENGMAIIAKFFDVELYMSKDTLQIKCDDEVLPIPKF